MDFSIPIGTKFACIALERVSSSNGLSKPLNLGDGLWVLSGPPFNIDQYWRELLGSLQTQHFSESNLLLFAIAPSNLPNVLDSENQMLEQSVWSLFYALLMHGVPQYDGGLLLTGGNGSGAVDVRSVTTLIRFYRPSKVALSGIDASTLRSAGRAAAGLRLIYARQQDFLRLKRGVAAWVKGVQESFGADRLHQFVRAIEALVKPSVGKTRGQFTHRCQLFAGRSDQVRRLLGELYDFRSCAEHMNDWQEVLSEFPISDRDTIGPLRAFQAELLAGHVYLRILKEDSLRDIFINDDSITQFWAKSDDERFRSWGDAIDLEAEAKARFRDYL